MINKGISSISKNREIENIKKNLYKKMSIGEIKDVLLKHDNEEWTEDAFLAMEQLILENKINSLEKNIPNPTPKEKDNITIIEPSSSKTSANCEKQLLNKQSIDAIRKILDKKDNNELREIWDNENHEDWTDEAFEAIRLILNSRGFNLSPKQLTTIPEKGASSSLSNAISAGILTGGGAALITHYMIEDKRISFATWLVAYVLGISQVKKYQWLSTIIFAIIAAFILTVFGELESFRILK